MEVITPGKIVPYKCCLPGLNISTQRNFDTDFLLTNIVTHLQVPPVMFIEYWQSVNKHNISQIKLFSGKKRGVYVTYVADVDNDMQ